VVPGADTNVSPEENSTAVTALIEDICDRALEGRPRDR